MRIRIRDLCPLAIFFLIPVLLSAEPLEAENLNRVIRTLSGLSIPFESRSLLADYGGFGSSLLVRSGSTEDDFSQETEGQSPGTFVFAVPLEADFAVDTALALAEKIKNKHSYLQKNLNNSANIIVAFLGDETNELPFEQGGISHKGLRDLLTLTDMPENWVLCYLDAAENPESLFLRHGVRGYVAPLDIVKPLPSLFRSRDISWSFRIRYNEIFKLGLVEGPEPLFIAWEEEINGFVLSGKSHQANDSKRKFPSGGNQPGPIPDSTAGKTVSPLTLAEVLLEYAESLDFPVLKADKHYFSFNLPGGKTVFVSEGHTAILLLLTAGIFLFLFLVYSARYNAILIFHIKLFFKSFWVFLILLPLLMISIKVSGLLYSLLFQAFGPLPGALSGRPNYAGMVLMMQLAVLVFFLPSPALDLFHFPKRAQFYGFSSVIFVILGLVSAAFLDFSFVPVFLLSFFFVFLGASLSRPLLVFICTFLIPISAFGALLNIFETGNAKIAELFLSPLWNTPDSWRVAFQTAVFSLPIFLLLRRGSILIQKSMHRGLEPKPKRQYRLIAVPILIVLVLGAMVVQILLIPKTQISPERRYIAEQSGTGNVNTILELSFDNVNFQDSRIITLRIGARGNPVRFDVSLESVDGVSLHPVYSAPVPFMREDNGKRIKFSLGEHPPNPLALEIVLPHNFTGLFKAEAVYNTWEPALEIGERPNTDDYILRVSRTIDLKR